MLTLEPYVPAIY
jgi:hypothetical protein